MFQRDIWVFSVVFVTAAFLVMIFRLLQLHQTTNAHPVKIRESTNLVMIFINGILVLLRLILTVSFVARGCSYLGCTYNRKKKRNSWSSQRKSWNSKRKQPPAAMSSIVAAEKSVRLADLRATARVKAYQYQNIF